MVRPVQSYRTFEAWNGLAAASNGACLILPSPAAKVIVSGAQRVGVNAYFPGGAVYVLKKDGSGNATWTSVSGDELTTLKSKLNSHVAPLTVGDATTLGAPGANSPIFEAEPHIVDPRRGIYCVWWQGTGACVGRVVAI